jgi:NTE family protein
MAGDPTIGVALGSGGARGLAHIAYIEAFDELGLKPTIIAGTSIGALIGAGWANGMSGQQLREHAVNVLGTLQQIAGRLWTNSLPSLQSVMQNGISVQVDAGNIVEAYLPELFPTDFAALAIRFKTVATDLYSWEQTVFDSGPLRPAIAASLAIPGLFRPLKVDGRFHIDGGTVNPLPVELARDGVDLVIGIDVNGTPVEPVGASEPSFLDVGFAATQIMARALVHQALRLSPPEIYVQAPVHGVRVLDFWRVREIIAQAEADKDAFKRSVERVLSRFGKAG